MRLGSEGVFHALLVGDCNLLELPTANHLVTECIGRSRRAPLISRMLAECRAPSTCRGSRPILARPFFVALVCEGCAVPMPPKQRQRGILLKGRLPSVFRELAAVRFLVKCFPLGPL
jgi:hypothetical protein